MYILDPFEDWNNFRSNRQLDDKQVWLEDYHSDRWTELGLPQRKIFTKAQNGFQGAYWEQRGSAWVLSPQTFLFSSSPLEDFLVSPCLPLIFSWFWYHTVIMISKVMTTDQFYNFLSLILFWSKVLEFFLQVLVWASSICQGLTASPSTLTRRGPLSQVNATSSLSFCQNIFS